MKTGRRLFRYAYRLKGQLLLGLTLLALSVAAELAGPLVAKEMIDLHILGIEKPWVEVSSEIRGAIPFRGHFYLRSDRIPSGTSYGGEVRFLQVGREIYFIPHAIAFDGERRIVGDQLVIQRGEEKRAYPAYPLTREEIASIYQREIHPFLLLSLLYLGFVFASALFHFGQRFLLQISANRIIQRMRDEVFHQIHRLPIRYFDHLPAGKVVSRITNDTEAVRDLYVTVLANFASGVIYLVVVYVALFYLDVRLASLTLLLIPFMILWAIIYRKWASRYNHKIRSLISEINGKINEAIQGLRIIQSFRREGQILSEFEKANEEHYLNQNKLQKLNALTSFNLVNTIQKLAFVLLIWYFGSGTLRGEMLISLGTLYAFVDYLNRLFQPIQGIVNQFSTMETAIVSAKRVFELMDEEGVDVEERERPAIKGHIRFEHVWFAYDEEEWVLKDITFEAPPGKTIALVGHTGSGKSSIMNLLFRFYEVQKGRITIDGRDIREFTLQELRKTMGIVLQDPFLFAGTISSNVSLEDPSITEEKVRQALKEVGGEEIFGRLPRGYAEPVLEKGSTFSLGERQIISFARALAFDPSILILDEATASIDTETEEVIQRALTVVKKGRTTLIIAHRLSTIKDADQILVLDRGRIVERGTHEELMELKGRYYRMYQLQQGGSDSAPIVNAGRMPVAET